MKPTVAVIYFFKIPKKFKTVAGTVSQSRKLLKSLRLLFTAVWSLKITEASYLTKNMNMDFSSWNGFTLEMCKIFKGAVLPSWIERE